MENEVQTIGETETSAESRPVAKTDSHLAVSITLVALLLWFGFQLLQQVRERSNLRAVKANQEGAIQESEKIRLQFQGLMTKTVELANQGHAGARMVVDELQKRGIGVPPPAKPAEKLETKPAK
ncbi:MAG TPA: hypothetical protein VJ646_01535 [Candidatus Binatia bacterium]|nr:hypothetical protein [Candidatus Binatia bacterium]